MRKARAQLYRSDSIPSESQDLLLKPQQTKPPSALELEARESKVTWERVHYC